jgi:hypothetical protein
LEEYLNLRMRKKMGGGREKERIICTEEPRNLCSSPNIIIKIEPSKLAYVGYVARMGQMGNAYRILI